MIFGASSSTADLLNQVLSFWSSLVALVILLNLLTVKREKNKSARVYKLFLYFAGISFLYSMMLTAVHQSVRHYHKVSDYNNYISMNQEVLITVLLALVLYFFYWKLVKNETAINRIAIVILGVFSTISVSATLLNYLS